MHISVLSMPEAVTDRGLLRDRAVAVIDVLRASSTIVTALVNGCREIVPVEEANDAIRLSHTLDHALLCGERGGHKINGFALGNSPLEYVPQAIAGRVLILSTTNGTRAIIRAREARALLIASFLNAQAVAAALAKTDYACILCAGTDGQFSLDDILCAGAILHRLDAMRALSDLDDLGRAALALYRSARGDLKSALLSTAHGRKLARIGAEADITHCAKEDLYAAVPWCRDGVIRV